MKEEDYEAIENEAAAPGTSKRALREDDTIDFDSRYQLKDYDDEEEEEGGLGCDVLLPCHFVVFNVLFIHVFIKKI